jgi:hypothetical protein
VNQTQKRAAVAAVCVALGIGVLGACTSEDKSSRAKESASRQSNYDRLVANQPAHTGDYSPTRETKNFWIDTWMKNPGKKSYVYIQNANGEYGYYILKGLPVSYCVSLLPPEVKTRGDLGGHDGDLVVQGPSMDGTYSSSSNCNTMYGKDAESGAYMEWTIGMNQSYFLYDQPMDLPQYKNAAPLGEAKIK